MVSLTCGFFKLLEKISISNHAGGNHHGAQGTLDQYDVGNNCEDKLVYMFVDKDKTIIRSILLEINEACYTTLSSIV